MRKRRYAELLTLLSIVVAAPTYANSNNGTNQITSVGIHDSGHALVVLVTSSNTEGCAASGLTNCIVIQKTNPNCKAMYATALLALSIEKPIQGWVNGCTDLWGNGTNIATATTLFFSK